MSNEGYVKFADGSVVSLECHEGRHRDCPDSRAAGANLDGYFCECGCDAHVDVEEEAS
jgi:hypothetical protein